MLVFVEASVLDEDYLLLNPSYSLMKEKLCTFKEGNYFVYMTIIHVLLLAAV